MKRILSMLLVFSVLLITACSKQKALDSYKFLENFTGISSEFSSDGEILTDGESSMFVMSDSHNNKILITLLHAENSLEIIGCSVTVASLTKESYNSFLSASQAAVTAFCDDENESVHEIFKSLRMAQNQRPEAALEIYRTVQYEYTFQINEAGADLTVINRFSAPETESKLTLREKDDYNSYTK